MLVSPTRVEWATLSLRRRSQRTDTEEGEAGRRGGVIWWSLAGEYGFRGAGGGLLLASAQGAYTKTMERMANGV